jgi:membrane protein insertase Oxa1/YidC/SpoIIIJ
MIAAGKPLPQKNGYNAINFLRSPLKQRPVEILLFGAYYRIRPIAATGIVPVCWKNTIMLTDRGSLS